MASLFTTRLFWRVFRFLRRRGNGLLRHRGEEEHAALTLVLHGTPRLRQRQLVLGAKRLGLCGDHAVLEALAQWRAQRLERERHAGAQAAREDEARATRHVGWRGHRCLWRCYGRNAHATRLKRLLPVWASDVAQQLLDGLLCFWGQNICCLGRMPWSLDSFLFLSSSCRQCLGLCSWNDRKKPCHLFSPFSVSIL